MEREKPHVLDPVPIGEIHTRWNAILSGLETPLETGRQTPLRSRVPRRSRSRKHS